MTTPQIIDTPPPASAYVPVLAMLRDDLLTRSQEPSVRAVLEIAWQKETAAERTANPVDVWIRGRATQVAAAWVLSVVFVRTLEDRGYLARRRIAGEGAQDSEHQFMSIAPFLSTRDYLLMVFREVARLPGAEEIFDARHNPVWVIGPSGDAARNLLAFFRQLDVSGELRFRYAGVDTRFLGDLYQDLDEDVRKTFALLQTPDFVEEFILKETLEPAVKTFGLKAVKLIDPTCGSGHFLLGAFRNLLEKWKDAEPSTETKVLAQKALAQVYGTDLNPYAIAVARFRLTLEFLRVSGINRLKDAPPLHLNLAVADSLLHGKTEEQIRLGSQVATDQRAAWGDEIFALEDEEEALRILRQRYESVVGNPPYIAVKDAKLRDTYRALYASCHRGYSLVAPFLERFFELATKEGYVGAIVGNAFMKREFGSKLIEEVLPKFELTQVVDTAGAYIPGHGTPTAILFGRNRKAGTTKVQAVMGKRGEPSTPDNAAEGLVWSAIRDNHQKLGFDNPYISVTEVERESLAKHPWSLGGGGAAELKVTLDEKCSTTLASHVESIGFGCITKQDDVFSQSRNVLVRHKIEISNMRPFGIGEDVRDWCAAEADWVVFPYNENIDTVPATTIPCAIKFMWPYRTVLEDRKVFGGKNYREVGKPWYEYGQIPRDRFRTPLSIAFAEVATHNHFVLDRGGKVFKQTAPIIKLPEGATEEDHLTLLAYLNSSTACFYMRQVAQQKQMMGGDGIRHTDKTTVTFAFNGTSVGSVPIPQMVGATRVRLIELARRMEALVSEAAKTTAKAIATRAVREGVDPRILAEPVTKIRKEAFAQMVGVQEEIDWLVYGAFGLCPEPDLKRTPPALLPGQRAFELLLRQATGAQRTVDEFEIPDPDLFLAGDTVGFERLRLCASSPFLSVIETSWYKRRWIGVQGRFNHGRQTWDEELAEAAWELMLESCEEELGLESRVLTVFELISRVIDLPKFRPLVAAFFGDFESGKNSGSAKLLEEAIPFLAAYRYTDAGMEKRAGWELAWELQRQEDAGRTLDKPIPVPPKYDPKDLRGSFFSHRGKLDVPKERFISYPGCESDEDPSPLLGWAGWDHLQQAQALTALFQRRKDDDGWDKDRLTPILAGLLELIPWLIQWHNQPDDRFGGACAGDSFDAFLRDQAHQLGLTLEDLRNWRPLANSKGKTKAVAKAPKAKASPKPSSDTDENALFEAMTRLSASDNGTVSRDDLAEALGIAATKVGKTADSLIAAGKLVKVSSRPLKYRLAEALLVTGEPC